MKKKAFPIFFSVSKADIAFADEVWERLPGDWVYLYSKTGEESAHMWDEISRDELPKSKVFVIFWSKNYISAEGCIREIRQASQMLHNNPIKTLILRLDDFPLFWSDSLNEKQKEIFSLLEPFLQYRSSHINVSVDHSVELISRTSEYLLASSHPRLPRPEINQAIRKSLQSFKDRFLCFPAAWISGFNGVGRETIIREFNRDFVPNGHCVTIDVNEATLPKQLLLRIESEGLGANRQRLEEVQDRFLENDIQEIAISIDRIVEAGNFVIFRHSRIVEERIALPEWLDDVVNVLKPINRCKLFIISQIPISPERRARTKDNMITARIPSIEEHTLRDYCYQLVSHFDPHPERWTEDLIEQIVSAAGGNIGFLVSLVRTSSQIEDFDNLPILIEAQEASIVEQITVYTRWVFSQLVNFIDEQRALIFLNEISPCDISDLERIVEPKRPMLRVIGKLLETGLVEREADNVYRLTPLLARRLSRDLVRQDLLDWLKGALIKLASNTLEFEASDHEFLRIESRIQAALISGESHLSENIARYVSAAHWFQAGIRLYHANRHESANRLLKKAFDRREDFAYATRIEIIRYYCLSATRWRKFSESEKCIQLLDGDYRTKEMSAFLRGNLYEFKGENQSAIEWYEKSLKLNKAKNTRLEQTYRPLISIMLRMYNPNFHKAEQYALSYVRLRKTLFSLMLLARVYLHWKYRGEVAGNPPPDNIDRLYRNAFAELAAQPGVQSAHFEVRAEEAEFNKDFEGALQYMTDAISADPRPLLRNERWNLMARCGSQEMAAKALRELDEIKINPDFTGQWGVLLPIISETYARALRAAGRPVGLVNQFAASLPETEIRAIIRKTASKHYDRR